MASTQRLGLLPPGQAGRQTEKARMEARKHCEEALEAFLLCLPSWRGGQRDNGSCMRSPSPAHQNSVKPKTEKQQAKQTHKEASKSKSRSRSRKRRRKEKEKKEKGVRRRDRSRSRSKERSRSRKLPRILPSQRLLHLQRQPVWKQLCHLCRSWHCDRICQSLLLHRQLLFLQQCLWPRFRTG